MKTKTLTVERGTCILTEEPFVHVFKSKYRKERCDYCLKLGKCLKYSNCQYVFYCNINCQKSEWNLHKFECAGLKKCFLIENKTTIPDAARILTRIIIKLQNGGDLVKSYYTENCYRKFKDLMSHYAEIKSDSNRMEHLESLTFVIRDLIGDSLLPNQQELLGIYGRLVINGFNILDGEMNSIATGIYLGVSVTDHSCTPNAVATFEGTTLKIHVTEDLPCLDWSKVFISYIDPFNTPDDRRKSLKENYYFLCTCTKCIDPIEPIEMLAAACENKKCNAFLNIYDDNCTKCNQKISIEHRKEYKSVMAFTQIHLENMKEIAYFDVCKVCLNKQENILHPLNLLHIQTLDSAFESALNFSKWEDALEFSKELIPGFRKYCGDWNPLLGILYIKVGKIQLHICVHTEALHSFNKALQIIKVTHGKDHSLYREQLIPLLIQASSKYDD